VSSHTTHVSGSLARGACGGMKPVRASTSKSWAARVDVSMLVVEWKEEYEDALDGPARSEKEPGRVNDLACERKWFGGRACISYVL
jgi:hypothetical protein